MNTDRLLKLSIVILNYNRSFETRRTINHLKVLLSNRNDVEIIAVDNGSSDDTYDFLLTQKKWVNVIKLEKNCGIAGLNVGFKQAQGDYIMVLDDDSHPKDESTIDLLIRHLDASPDIGVVACHIEKSDHRPLWTWHLPKNMDEPGSSMAFVG